MPDLIIIQSKNLKDLDAPWQVSDIGWTTCWVQYATSGGEARFSNWIFLDGVFASEEDRKKVAAYLDSLADQEVSIRRYRSSSASSNLPILLTGKSSSNLFLVNTETDDLLSANCQMSSASP